jgi:hypothetical protein
VRRRALFRASCAKWFAAPVFWFAWYLGDSQAEFVTRGYGPSAVVSGLLGGVFVAASVSGCAAWDAGRLRRAGVWRLAPSRGPYRVAGEALLPAFCLGAAGITAGLASSVVATATWPSVDSLPMIAVELAVVCAHGVIGFAVGSVLHRLVAAPLMLIATYMWMGLPQSIDNNWLRHTTGFFSDGLGVNQLYTWAALALPVLVAGTAVLGIALAVRFSRPTARVAVAAAVAALGIAGGDAIASDWPYTTPITYGHQSAVCAGTAPRVCVPQLYASMLPRLRTAVDDTTGRLARVGVPRPTLVSHFSLPGPQTSSLWRISAEPGASDAQLRIDVSQAIPAVRSATCLDGETAELSAWAALTAGASEQDLASNYPITIVTQAQAISREDNAVQTRWYLQASAHSDSCSRKAPK